MPVCVPYKACSQVAEKPRCVSRSTLCHLTMRVWSFDMPPRALTYITFVVLMLVVGFAASLSSLPGEWYERLHKPSFNPPNWIFGPVWTVLYVLIGLAGGISSYNNPSSSAMKFWWIQLVLNGIWSPIFFAYKMPVLALIIILLMLAAIIAFMKTSFSQTPAATYLFVPYFAWVAFATMLNAAIVWLN